MNDLRAGPEAIRDVGSYERRRYPPGYFSRFKKNQDVRTLHETIGPGPLRVLDLPCGAGRLMEPMMGRDYRVVGADISREMLAAGMHRMQGRKGFQGLVRCDIGRLPFREGSFDLVVCMRFLYYFEAAERVLLIREMARLSRRWLILQYRLHPTLPSLLWKLRHRAGMTSRDRSRRCLSVRDIRREVEQAAGLRIIRVRPVSVFFSDRAYILCIKGTQT